MLSQAVMIAQDVPVQGDQQAADLTRQPDGSLMVYPSKRSSLVYRFFTRISSFNHGKVNVKKPYYYSRRNRGAHPL